MNIKVPIYFSAGLTIQANMYYKMLISWTSQRVKETYTKRNAFDFKNVHKFDRSMINDPGPCVLFATPGMISGGFSLEVFKQWAPSESNLVTLPGYCVAGTIGHRLMSGKPTKIDMDDGTQIDVRCQIHQLSFSPHTDAKGIMDLVKFLSPKHVVLVHGEKPKMASLKEKIQCELGITCHDPANNERRSIPLPEHVKAEVSEKFLRSCLSPNFKISRGSAEDTSTSGVQADDERVTEGILVQHECKKLKVFHQDEFLHMLGKNKHDVHFTYCCPVRAERPKMLEDANSAAESNVVHKCSWLRLLLEELLTRLPGENIQDLGELLQVDSFRVSACTKENCPYRIADIVENKSETMYFCCAWSMEDENIAWKIISVMKDVYLTSEGKRSFI